MRWTSWRFRMGELAGVRCCGGCILGLVVWCVGLLYLEFYQSFWVLLQTLLSSTQMESFLSHLCRLHLTCMYARCLHLLCLAGPITPCCTAVPRLQPHLFSVLTPLLQERMTYTIIFTQDLQATILSFFAFGWPFTIRRHR